MKKEYFTPSGTKTRFPNLYEDWGPFEGRFMHKLYHDKRGQLLLSALLNAVLALYLLGKSLPH